MDEHDASAGRAIDVEAHDGAERARADGHGGRDREHALEAVRQQVGDRAGRDQHRDHQDDADGLERSDDRQGQEDQEAVVERADRQSDRAGVVRIEAVEQQIAALEQDDQQRSAGDDGGLDQIAHGHP